MLRWLRISALCLLSACGAGEDGSRASLTGERPDEPNATRPAREEAPAAGPAGATHAAPPPPTVAAPAFTIRRLDGPTLAEDGAGGVAPSERAVAIDLDAARFPPRALDPVLSVGARRFVHYHHPEVGTLRFVAAGPELLEDGAELAVQYGDDARSRVVLAAALTVPAEVRR